jgi:hypothetical protein
MPLTINMHNFTMIFICGRIAPRSDGSCRAPAEQLKRSVTAVTHFKLELLQKKSSFKIIFYKRTFNESSFLICSQKLLQ